jgi:hypothetical protein
VSYKIEDFGVFDGRHVENVLNVGKMPSRTQLDEFDAQANECYQAHLNHIVIVSFFDDVTVHSGEIGMIDTCDGAAKKEGKKEILTHDSNVKASSKPKRRIRNAREARRPKTIILVRTVTKIIPAMAGASFVALRYSAVMPFGTRPSAKAFVTFGSDMTNKHRTIEGYTVSWVVKTPRDGSWIGVKWHASKPRTEDVRSWWWNTSSLISSCYLMY